MLINVSDVAFGYDDRLIFSEVNFALNEGERVGFIGANGEGKTTLIRLITGELTPTYGEVNRKNGCKIGYLEQNGGYESGATVYEEMRAVFARQIEAVETLASLSSRLSETGYGSREYAVLSAKMEAVQKYISANDCYNIDVKIRTVLNGMGFADFYDRVIDGMSGGEKTRLKLARLLLESPDLLILDEPTNHLDVKTLFWLEDYLTSFRGAVFVVSHDRYFLDRIVTKTLEIENKKVYPYAGNYSKYKILKAERVALAEKEYEKQQEEIKKLREYVAKNIVRATTAKSAQSRVKQLEKMDVQEKPYLPPKPPVFRFTYRTPPYERVLTLKDFHLSVGSKSLICGGQLEILRGQKVAVVGENGTGKSSLLKEIAVGQNPAAEMGRYVRFAVYDQENANLNGENTVLQELWERHVASSQTDVRASLARCGLFSEDMDKKVKSLSGGERAKLALCVFENEHGNVLLLDEPTNHLDLPARESLEKALKEFDGTVLFVSHDRYFISAVADAIVEIEDKKLRYYPCGYDGFKAAKEKREEERRAEEDNRRRAACVQEKSNGYRSGKERAEEARRKAEMKRIEGRISAEEEEEARLNGLLADPEVTKDFARLTEVLNALSEVRKKLDGLYAEYGEYV